MARRSIAFAVGITSKFLNGEAPGCGMGRFENAEKRWSRSEDGRNDINIDSVVIVRRAFFIHSSYGGRNLARAHPIQSTRASLLLTLFFILPATLFALQQPIGNDNAASAQHVFSLADQAHQCVSNGLGNESDREDAHASLLNFPAAVHEFEAQYDRLCR